MKFPIMSGTHDVIAVQPALTERAAGVIAHAGNDAEYAVAMREGELGATEGDFGQWPRNEICCCADILPVCVSHDELSAECPQPFNRSISLCLLCNENAQPQSNRWRKPSSSDGLIMALPGGFA